MDFSHFITKLIYIISVIFLLGLILGLFSSCTVVKTNFSSESKKKANVYYYLPESIIKIKTVAKVAVIYRETEKTLLGSSHLIDQSFIISSEIISDTKDLLALNYKPNVLMSDEIKYSVNSKGLLETVNISTEDRTAEIISQLSTAPKIILGTSGEGEKGTGEIIKIKDYSAEFVIKASEITSKRINWKIIIENELGINEFKTLNIDFIVSSSDVMSPQPISTLINGTSPKIKSEINGIITRPLKNIQVSVKSTDPMVSESLPIYIVIADASKLINIPIGRAAFVKRINNIVMQDGIIVSNEIKNPSSLEGFISIPINIAKAIVSIPTELIQFKYNNVKNKDELEKAKLSYEKSIQDNQKFALTKSQELENVKLEIQKTDMSNQIELQKQKLELEKSLLIAEKDKLDAFKNLEALKKEIEDLKSK